MKSTIIGGVACLFLAMSACSSCTRVGPGYAGIKVNMAGTDRGVSEYAATTGYVFTNPFTQTVMVYPTFVQTAIWKKGPEGEPNEEITFNTKDKMRVDLDVSLGYHLEFACIPRFYVQFRNDDLVGFTHGFLHNVARDKFVEVGGTYGVDQIMGGSGEFLAKVHSDLQKAMDPFCVKLDQFGILGAIRPPLAVLESINASAQATQKAIQIQNEVMQAEAQARKNVAQAEGESKSLQIKSEAEAKANRLISESLTGNLVDLRRIEKWDGHMPQVTSSATPMLNIGK